MKVDPALLAEMRKDFAGMKSRQEFLALLNKANKILYGEKAIDIKLKQLTWYANPEKNTARYKTFLIKKKSGGERIIHAPVQGLKRIQRALAFILQCVFEPHQAVMGFVWGKSIVDNARIHVGSRYVYNIDLKDFFPSIDQARVWKCLQLQPFNLNDDDLGPEERILGETGIRKIITDMGEVIYYKIGKENVLIPMTRMGDYEKYRERLTSHLSDPRKKNKRAFALTINSYETKVREIIFDDLKRFVATESNIKDLLWSASTRLRLANLIAALCCTEMTVDRENDGADSVKVTRNVLPQGAPTSPVLTNVICQRLDRRLAGAARRFGATYSRYADDITFSSNINIFMTEGEFLEEVTRIIREQGFKINHSKVRLQKDGYRKEVTGLVVNEKVNVTKRYIKQIRMWLYYWERYGYDRAQSFFLQHYYADKGHVKKGKPEMANVLAGKLDYLKMVRGDEDPAYQKMRGRLDALLGFTSVDFILDTWENEGIDAAIEIYYSNHRNP